jgi:hypothetical protein
MKNLWTILALITSMNLVFAREPKPSEIPVIKGSWWQIAHEDFDAGAYSNKPTRENPPYGNISRYLTLPSIRLPTAIGNWYQP